MECCENRRYIGVEYGRIGGCDQLERGGFRRYIVWIEVHNKLVICENRQYIGWIEVCNMEGCKNRRYMYCGIGRHDHLEDCGVVVCNKLEDAEIDSI